MSRRWVAARARRLTGAGTAASAIVVAVAGAVALGSGGDDRPQAASPAAHARPGHPAPSASRPHLPLPPRASSTQRPSRGQTSSRPTVHPATRPVTDLSPGSKAASQLRSLAALLRDDRSAQRSAAVRSAAATLDKAADQRAAGSQATADELVRAAFAQLAQAQRVNSWQPTGPEANLLRSLGYRSPALPASEWPDE